MDLKKGIFTDLTNEQYHASEGISNSGISLILDAPIRYWYKYIAKKDEFKPSKALRMGTYLHMLVLEPDLFDKTYAVDPGLDKRSSANKQVYADILASGKELINAEEYETVRAMKGSIVNHPRWSFIFKDARIENSLFWQDLDVTLRSRPDFYTDLLIGDLKTTDSVHPEAFAKSIANYGYHRQAAMAIDGMRELTGKEYEHFVIVAVEKEPPYLSAIYRIDDNAIKIGREEYKKGLLIYKRCLETNEWPDYGTDIKDVYLPNFYKSKAA